MAIIAGMFKGTVPRDAVEPEEVSKLGKYVLDSIRALDKPTSDDIILHASEVLGGPREALKEYLFEATSHNAGADTSEILRKVRDKQVLLDLINEAGSQLQKGSLDLTLINGLLTTETATSHHLESAADLIKDGLPPKPTGFTIRSLPYLTQQTGGIYGVWAVGGGPGVGKSTLAWQIALDLASQGIPVLEYDFENGFAVLMDHTNEIFKGNIPKMREATKNIYVRDSIRSLDSDLARVPPPALIVVDSIQKLPGSVEYRRNSLDRWIHRLEYLKKRGYCVLLVSEIGRASYGGDAYIGSFKETGEIEYSADTGLQLIDEGTMGVSVVIVKNRHRPHKGPVAILQRKDAWRFKEVPTTGADALEPMEIN